MKKIEISISKIDVAGNILEVKKMETFIENDPEKHQHHSIRLLLNIDGDEFWLKRNGKLKKIKKSL